MYTFWDVCFVEMSTPQIVNKMYSYRLQEGHYGVLWLSSNQYKKAAY